MSHFSRRGFLKGLAVAAGAAAGARIPGAGWIGEAQAATEPTAVVFVYLRGGYNAIFASAGQLQGSFGVTAGNFTGLGNGLSVDNVFANTMSPFVKNHMAAVGVRHGISNHPGAQAAVWTQNGGNAGLHLANAIGGSASIKAAFVGDNMGSIAMPRGAVAGTSFQVITDMQKTIEALGGGAPDPRVPDRSIAVSGMTNAEAMSANALAGSPESLDSLSNGYRAAIDTLKQPAQVFDYNTLKTAYGLGNGTAVRSFASKMAAAELMVRSGTNVVTVNDQGWDTHGDRNGSVVRTKMTGLMPALNTFMTRMVQDPTRNVVVAILCDFSRSLPGSDHQPNLTATVIGKYVKQGTTGRVSASVGLPTNTPGIQGFWSYLSAVSKTTNKPFGNNLHPTLLLP
jgi:hypothetical protein